MRGGATAIAALCVLALAAPASGHLTVAYDDRGDSRGGRAAGDLLRAGLTHRQCSVTAAAQVAGTDDRDAAGAAALLLNTAPGGGPELVALGGPDTTTRVYDRRLRRAVTTGSFTRRGTVLGWAMPCVPYGGSDQGFSWGAATLVVSGGRITIDDILIARGRHRTGSG